MATQLPTGLRDYVRNNRDEYQLIATSQDWHVDPGTHFSDSPDFVDSWPPHGLAGTPNAELHPALRDALGPGGADVRCARAATRRRIPRSRAPIPTVSRWRCVLADGRRAAELDVCGIAESHCVRASAEDALQRGLAVRLLTDLTVAVIARVGRRGTSLDRRRRRRADQVGLIRWRPSSTCGARTPCC